MSKIRFASEEYVDSKIANGAATQPDWAQNDKIAPDYIKNKPFYEIPRVSYTFEFTDPIIDSISTTMLVPKPNFWAADKTYRIWVDGEEYVFEGMKTKPGGNPFAMKNVYYIGAEWVAFNPNMNFSQYPFCFLTADFENVYAVFEDGTTNHVVELIEKEGEFKYIDPKFIKDMYYDNDVTITEVVPETTVEIGQDFPAELNLDNITVGNTYIVTWNGELYECVCYQFEGSKVIGNVEDFGAVGGNGEPFCIVNFAGMTQVMALEAGTYTISITEHVHDIKHLDEKYIPDTIARKTDLEAAINAAIGNAIGGSY